MIDTLYIIGNGFDLHHGLKTSYEDFREYCAKNRHFLWDSLLEVYGDQIKQDMWWWSFEERLGQIDYKHLMDSNNGEALGIPKVKNILKNHIPFFLGEWIRDVDCDIKPDTALQIDKDSLFFSFNYTLVLENVYGVEKENVWHIHNSLMDIKGGINPVVGPDPNQGQLIEHLTESRKQEPTIRFDLADDINQEIENASKKVRDRISIYKDRFSNYSNIKHYVSLGFSFNEIDLPYLEEICNVNPNLSLSDWVLYWHSNEEKARFLSVMNYLGIDRDKVVLREW